jgi:hypothetical protein
VRLTQPRSFLRFMSRRAGALFACLPNCPPNCPFARNAAVWLALASCVRLRRRASRGRPLLRKSFGTGLRWEQTVEEDMMARWWKFFLAWTRLSKRGSVRDVGRPWAERRLRPVPR